MEKKLLTLSVCLFITYSISIGQRKPDTTESVNAAQRGKPFIYRPGKDRGLAKSSASVKEILRLGNRDELTLLKKPTADRNGFENAKYQQFHNGIPVEQGAVTVSTRKGNIISIVGEVYDIPSGLSSSPSIAESTALEIALQHVNATRYKWENMDEKKSGFPGRIEDSSYYPKAVLVFIKPHLPEGTRNDDEIALAYKFDIYAEVPLSRKYVFVDAHRGVVIFENSIIKHAEDGLAQTRYSGSKSISTSYHSALNKFVLRDDSRGLGIETYNLNNGVSYNDATHFTDEDNNWEEYNNAKKDNAALDAHWGAMMTYDYFLKTYGRNSYDGNGSIIQSYVHFANDYSNAFWDGSVMTYGDGDATTDPFTSLDICAHEIAHAICSSTADLVYFNESGALNESLSDIWAASIEHYAAPEKSTWDIGEDINLVIRSMSDPNKYQQPDTYEGIFWYTGFGDSGGVHYNSGVMNHWYYILVTGKSGTNDHGNNYSVDGIGFNAAADIVYRMETTYLTPNSQYIDARNAAIHAAIDIFGDDSNELIQVRNAWDAVGVYDFELAPTQLIASVVSNGIVKLNWTDNSNNETAFILERSKSFTSGYTVIDVIPENIVSYTDINLLPGAYYYRIKALVDGYYTAPSNTAGAAVSVSPVLMSNSEITTCDKVFLDPGGFVDYDSYGDFTLVVNPSDAGKKVSIKFSDFSLTTGDNIWFADDLLEIFDGNTTDAPKIGAYTGATLPPQLNATNASGSLTFRFKSDGFSEDFGWHANLSCVTIPHLIATPVSSTQVNLTWQDNDQTGTGYSVQRKAFGNTSFEEIAFLPVNSTDYSDIGLMSNNLYEYRVSVLTEASHYAHSNVATSVVGSEPFTMVDGDYSICNVPFLDPGGNGPYEIAAFGEIYTATTTTLSPIEPGTKISVSFSAFDIEDGYDFLLVYDGATIDSPVIGEFTGSNLPPKITATNPEGKLTFEFWTDYGFTGAGWRGEVSCVTLPLAPENLLAQPIGNTHIRLTWKDNATDETGYAIERATADQFITIATIGPDTQVFDDATIETERKYTYRVRATREGVFSPFSNTSTANIGSEPLLMQNGEVMACGRKFMDSGGDREYSKNENFILTLLPDDVPGSKVRVDFISFETELNWDKLFVYDGASIEAPILGTYTGTSGTALPSTVIATNPEGKLTFKFKSESVNEYAGWESRITCVTPPAVPGNLQAQWNGGQINLTWEDNSNDEIGFIVERATGNQYVELITTDANAESYMDTDFANNRTLTYRVRSKRNDLSSGPSNTSSVDVGASAVAMHSGSVTTCNAAFLDPGGDENYGRDDVTMTISPSEPGKRVVVTFTAIDLLPNADVLEAYNGGNTFQDKLWSWHTNDPASEVPVAIQAVNASGQLTFKFGASLNGERRSGWTATISCVDKGQPTIVFPDKTVKYSHPDDEIIFLHAQTYAPNGPISAFTYSLVEDDSNTGAAEITPYFGGIKVNPLKTGTVKIKASLAENQYFFSGEKTMTLTVNKGTRKINFDFPAMYMGIPPFELHATVGQLPNTRADNFTFEMVPPTAVYTGEVILSGDGNNMITPSNAGYVKVKAILAETDLYLPGEKTIAKEIKKNIPNISFSNLSITIGSPPFDLNATAFAGADLFYSVEGVNSGAVTLSGPGNKTLTPVLPGTVLLKAYLPESQNYFSSEKTAVLNINPSSGLTPQTITFNPLPVKNYGDESFQLTATASSGLPIVYHSSNPFVASVFGDVVIIHAAGSVTITAMQPGNNNFSSAEPVSQSFDIIESTKAPQTITFSSLPILSYGHEPLQLTGTASSGLPVHYTSSDDNIVFISGETATIRAAGLVTITASQPGNEIFASATPVQQTFIIRKKGLIASSQNVTRAYGEPNPEFVATYQGFVNGDNEAALDEKPSGLYTLATETSNVGNYFIAFASLGTDNNYEIVQGSGTLTIVKANQTIDFAPLPDVVYTKPPFALTATTNSGLLVDFFVRSGPATITSFLLTLTGETGVVTIDASQAGNENYYPAETITRNFSVLPETILSADDESATFQVDLWPSPASEFVNVRSRTSKIFGIILTDGLARKILNRKCSSEEVHLDLNSLPNGLYVLQIQFENGKMVQRRFQISR